jgi:hypothetical protein
MVRWYIRPLAMSLVAPVSGYITTEILVDIDGGGLGRLP